MEFVKQAVELITGEGICKIEEAARTCYRSEGLIGCPLSFGEEGAMEKCPRKLEKAEDCPRVCDLHSSHTMFNKLYKRRHYAMLEHEWFVAIVQVNPEVQGLTMQHTMERLQPLTSEEYIMHRPLDAQRIMIGGPIRAFIEAYQKLMIPNTTIVRSNAITGPIFKALASFMPAINGPETMNVQGHVTGHNDPIAEGVYQIAVVDPHKLPPGPIREQFCPVTMRFRTNTGVTHEFVRHRRRTSFGQESTRWISYKNLIFIAQEGYGDFQGEVEDIFAKIEDLYGRMKTAGIKTDVRRGIIPKDIKADIVVTAPIYQWRWMFAVRKDGVTGVPHPQFKELMEMAWPLFEEYITPPEPPKEEGPVEKPQDYDADAKAEEVEKETPSMDDAMVLDKEKAAEEFAEDAGPGEPIPSEGELPEGLEPYETPGNAGVEEEAPVTQGEVQEAANEVEDDDFPTVEEAMAEAAQIEEEAAEPASAEEAIVNSDLKDTDI